MIRRLALMVAALLVSADAFAIIIIPIPNLAFPAALGKIRDALEKSTETKALATVGEDKIFGSKQWVWGQASGKMTQADADQLALRRCETSLANQKSQMVGGQPLYDFGSKKCELYKFASVTLSLPDATAQPEVTQAAGVGASAPPATSVVPAPAPAPSAAAASSPQSVAGAAQTPSSTPAVTPSDPAASAPAASAPAATSQQPATKASSDIVQKMKDLDTLFKQNLITKDEYEKKKKQLLDAL